MKKQLVLFLMTLLSLTAFAQSEPYAVLSEGNTVLTFYYDDQKESRNGMDVGPFELVWVGDSWTGHYESNSSWYEYHDQITTVVFADSFANCTSITSTACWFFDCTQLTAITGIGNLNTGNVSDMSAMFMYCSRLTSLDVNGFDTSNVTDMYRMFDGCSSLTSLDVSGFNTSKVTNMTGLFMSCSNLTNLDLSGFDTSNVVHMANMFMYCSRLTSLDLSSFNTSKVTDMLGMFCSCSNLTSLDVSSFDTSNVTHMGEMFMYCSDLTSLDLSSFNTSNVTQMFWMFQFCYDLTTIYVGSNWSTASLIDNSGFDMFNNCSCLVGGNGTVYDPNHTDAEYARIDKPGQPGYFSHMPYAVLSDGGQTVTFYYDGQKAIRDGIDINNSNTDTSPYGTATTAVFDASFADYRPESTRYWFSKCSSLTTIIGIENLNTSNVTDMGLMFAYCSSLISLDLSSFDTSNVTSMFGMFEYCSGLTSIDLSGFNTSNVTSVTQIFCRCSNLKTIYVDEAKWSTANLRGRAVFSGCNSLVGGNGTVYDASHTDAEYARIDKPGQPGYLTQKSGGEPEPYAVLSSDGQTVTFYYDDQKASRGGIDINNVWTNNSPYGTATTAVFDASFADYRPESTAYWFSKCSSLTTINGIENLKTDNVTDMQSMFWGCTSLTNLDVSGFNTSKVTDMGGLFGNCLKLNSLNLSNFDTSNVTNMNCLFYGCDNLTSL